MYERLKIEKGRLNVATFLSCLLEASHHIHKVWPHTMENSLDQHTNKSNVMFSYLVIQ